MWPLYSTILLNFPFSLSSASLTFLKPNLSGMFFSLLLLSHMQTVNKSGIFSASLKSALTAQLFQMSGLTLAATANLSSLLLSISCQFIILSLFFKSHLSTKWKHLGFAFKIFVRLSTSYISVFSAIFFCVLQLIVFFSLHLKIFKIV